MVTSKRYQYFYFCLFLLPALLLYATFFIYPLLQGVKYSLTDWNGIVPEIPFSMEKTEFETKVLKRLPDPKDRAYLQKYYTIQDGAENYNLSNWIVKGGQSQPLSAAEKRRIKGILKSVGITPIKFVGLSNYREMFKNDQRFVPRFEKRFLYNEFQDLPEKIGMKDFHKNLLRHIKNKDEQKFVLTQYQPRKSHYILRDHLPETESDKLRTILSANMYQTIFIPGVIGFTFFFTFFNVIFANLAALILALALDTKIKSKNFLRSVFFFPNVLSLIIVAFIWSFVFRLILPSITGISVWLGNPDLAPYALLMVTIWQGCGWLMVIYLAGLQTIPSEVLEVAEVDGAPWWTRFRHITAPLLIPAFTICVFFSLSNSLKTFDIIMALTQGGPGYVTTPIVLDIYYNAFRDNLYGYATAKAVFLCIIIMLVTGIQLFFMKRKEVEL